jgi:Lar family restriction alleviation protein
MAKMTDHTLLTIIGAQPPGASDEVFQSAPPVMTTEGLKPCPFCGGEAVQFTYPAEGSTSIRCMSCGANSRAYAGQEQHLAFKAWNRRAD